MGIEPFLILGIVVAMFVVQLGRAARAALADRVEYAALTMDGANEHAARLAMAPDVSPPVPPAALVPLRATAPAWIPPPVRTVRAWTLHHDGLHVRLLATRRPEPARRAVRLATGVRQRNLGQHRGWFTPSVLVVVTLPRTVAAGLRVGTRASVVDETERLALNSPVLDQLLRVTAQDPAATRALLAEPAVHEPLIELMATHPLSVVTGRVIALWCTVPVGNPAPLVGLAEELGRAMLDFARPSGRE